MELHAASVAPAWIFHSILFFGLVLGRKASSWWWSYSSHQRVSCLDMLTSHWRPCHLYMSTWDERGESACSHLLLPCVPPVTGRKTWLWQAAGKVTSSWLSVTSIFCDAKRSQAPCHHQLVYLGLGTRSSQLAASLATCLLSWDIFARWRWWVLLGAQRTLLSTCNFFLSELSFLFIAFFLIFLWASNDSDYAKCGTFHVLWKWLSDPTPSA